VEEMNCSAAAARSSERFKPCLPLNSSIPFHKDSGNITLKHFWVLELAACSGTRQSFGEPVFVVDSAESLGGFRYGTFLKVPDQFRLN